MVKPKHPSKINKHVLKKIKPMDQTEPQNPENTDLEVIPDLVTVRQDQLNALVEQNETVKNEVAALVGLFLNFEGLLNGNASILSLIPVITKLINDPKMKQQVEAIMPIIQKYKA